MGQIRSQLSLLWQQENQDMHVLMQALSMPVCVCVCVCTLAEYIVHFQESIYTNGAVGKLCACCDYCPEECMHVLCANVCVCVCSTAHAHTVTHISSYHFSVLKADPGALLFFFFKNLAATVKV